MRILLTLFFVWGSLAAAQANEQEGMDFLLAHMPAKDKKQLSRDFLAEQVRLAYQVKDEVPWGKQIPEDIFLNDVLPYASVNERRDNWRQDFHDRFIKTAQESKTIDATVRALNNQVFKDLNVSYDPTKRPKAEQSPYESMKAHYASCTGLSILLVDALRSMGIPARIAGIAMWPDNSGNHTWVEFWDGRWRYIGAAEPTEIDQTWFSTKAATTDDKHPIYATSFKATGRYFPMRWAHRNKTVPAVDVTKNYTLTH